MAPRKRSAEEAPTICQKGTPVLHRRAEPVPEANIGSPPMRALVDHMVRVMRAAPGVGLAAPQIGVGLRIFVAEDPPDYQEGVAQETLTRTEREPFTLKVFFNPVLVPSPAAGTATFREGCLSADGESAEVTRFLEVIVTGLDANAQPVRWHARGWQARIAQHEFDHLEGTLYLDKMQVDTHQRG